MQEIKKKLGDALEGCDTRLTRSIAEAVILIRTPEKNLLDRLCWATYARCFVVVPASVAVALKSALPLLLAWHALRWRRGTCSLLHGAAAAAALARSALVMGACVVARCIRRVL